MSRWMLATWVVIATAARAGEPAAGAEPKGDVEALVLGSGSTPAEAEVWLKRWKEARPIWREVLRPLPSFPRVVATEVFAGLEPGRSVAVLGFCAAGDTALPLAIVRSLFPEAFAQAARAAAECPELVDNARVRVRHTLGNGARRLVLTVYLVDPKAGARRDPPDPESGQLLVRPMLLDGDSMLTRYDTSYNYDSVTDSLEAPSRCDLRIREQRSRITVDISCEEKVPPCSGRVTKLVQRLSFGIAGEEIDKRDKVLQMKKERLCD